MPEDLATIWQSSKIRAYSIAAQAIESGSIIIWAVNLRGEVQLSEGGGLYHLGMFPGQTVGQNIREWLGTPFDLAVKHLSEGRESANFISVPTLHPGAKLPAEALEYWGCPWVYSVGYLRSASGKIIGHTCLAFPLKDMIHVSPFDACPLGTCFVERDTKELEAS